MMNMKMVGPQAVATGRDLLTTKTRTMTTHKGSLTIKRRSNEQKKFI